MNASSEKEKWPWGEGYQKRFQTSEQVEETVQLLDMDSASRLVDIGCGNGKFAIAVAKRLPACRVWAFDPLETAIAECKKAAGALLEKNLNAGIADAQRIPLPDACADRVLMRNVLHHVPDPAAAIAEMGRLLKPGGQVLLEGPGNHGDAALGELISDFHFIWDDSHRRRYHRPETLIGWFADAGIQAELATSWLYTARMGVKATRLIIERGAARELGLETKPDGSGVVKLTIFRITGSKEESS